jgi:hypothetical protein
MPLRIPARTVSVVDEGFELVLLDDADRNDFYGDSHVLAMVHGSVFKQISLMSIVMNFASGVDRMLLKRSLAVVRSAVGVLTSPGY